MLSGIFRINSEKARNRDACNTIMFFYVFSNIFSTICITAIAVNLQIVFVHEKKSKHLEKWYLLASFIAAFIIAVIPLFPNVEAYNYNMNLHECWYWQPDSKTTTLWTIMGLYVWILVSTAYCLVALVLVLGKMWREEFIINEQLRLQMTSRHNNTYYRKNKWFYSFPWSLFFRPPQADPITDVLGQEEASVIDSNNNMNEQQQQQQPQQQQKRKRFRLPSIKYLRPQYILKLVSARVKHTLQTIKIIRKQQLQVSYVAKVASRVIWFPIILILSRIWSVIVYIMAYRDGKINPFMLFMTYLSIPMQGTVKKLYCLFFFCLLCCLPFLFLQKKPVMAFTPPL
ncbi:hypothetical protein BDA99DRAFT_135595 [Phascolomyces articulosus]|uniref:G-protein coupled receptors family 2 profile 2 domain-containing protein n=1 Tax=Phascolomyces articulosus TaxID=60185 RepID=A0AAD5JWI7_9FUNG|nr:hypothetical protein BDA99DRAFT_135595 [Phascolomyces articulosus]